MEREQLNYYLQQLPLEEILALQEQVEKCATVITIQKPTSQTLLVPVHDPINNGTFYGGEVLVTSTIVQVNSINGWSMVMDDSPRQAQGVAILDGAYGADILKEEITQLAIRGKNLLEEENKTRNSRIHSTRVAFDLL